MTANEKKYNIWIVVISILIPIVVASLFRITPENLKEWGFNVKPLTFLPPIYATINGFTAVLLIAAVNAVKKGNRKKHEMLMKIAMGCSIAFLLMYIAYHATTASTPYGGEGALRYIYFFILITHILLSIVVIPLVLISFVRALSERFDKHRKIARIAYPIWLYVAVSGVLVYLMISPYYTH